jgi:CheY-like chemotaxis protein
VRFKDHRPRDAGGGKVARHAKSLGSANHSIDTILLSLNAFVFVALDVTEMASNVDGAMKRSPEPARTTCGKIRILVVEDEALIAEWVAEALGEQGFEVQTASNAVDALCHLASSSVDLLFTDINLRGAMDGTALARCARELLPRLPVIYASARVAALTPDVCVPGAVFLPKPYRVEALGRLIAEVCKIGGEHAFA